MQRTGSVKGISGILRPLEMIQILGRRRGLDLEMQLDSWPWLFLHTGSRGIACFRTNGKPVQPLFHIEIIFSLLPLVPVLTREIMPTLSVVRNF